MYQAHLMTPARQFFLDMMGNIVWRFEHPEFILEVAKKHNRSNGPQMKEDIPEYFLSRKHPWVDKDLSLRLSGRRPSSSWKARFLSGWRNPAVFMLVHELRKTEERPHGP